MNDEHLDRRVLDADPYRPLIIGRLDGEQQNLLEEIVSLPVPAPRHRTFHRSTAGALAVAAAVTAVLVVSSVVSHRPSPPLVAPTYLSASGPALGGPPVLDPAAVLKAAGENPRLLIDQPGWKVTSVYGFAEKIGSITFAKAGRSLEMTWYPADQYQDYYTDRLDVSPPQAVQVDKWAGDLFRYSDSDFAIMLRPRDGVFVEFRTSGQWTRTIFDQVAAKVVRVDVQTWLAALPPETVTPGKVNAEAAKILADVPLPPDFDINAMNIAGTNDPYQFGAEVTGRVGCAWIAEWFRADRAGDTAARQRAEDAMTSSRHWQVLNQMSATGFWPEAFWEVADKMAAGKPPTGSASGLGCA